MGIRVTDMVIHARQILRRQKGRSHSISSYSEPTSTAALDVPKGCFAVYVGEEDEEKKRFVIPISYLRKPSFQDLLREAGEEFGFDPPTGNGGLRIPCSESHFLDLTFCLAR
ncbi:auxin-induced protein 15A-like [Argentina anserina]|uniref:auxin-induced protein 15A-like n=1 Tax=Argentina anserina TaxID=57926 RepID=UPI0021761F09|nr:auxin-induced protein 15A-like [Potentilla anserina]